MLTKRKSLPLELRNTEYFVSKKIYSFEKKRFKISLFKNTINLGEQNEIHNLQI